MGSKAGDVWKFVVPVLPCGSSRKKTYYPACLLRSKAPCGTANCKSSTSNSPVDLPSALQKLREEISAVGARMSYVDEQMEHIKAALPDLDSKIRYASLGMPLSSLSLEEMLHLKGIHFKLLQFWEELKRKQLEKLGVLSDCLQVLEEQRASAASKQGEEPPGNAARNEEDFYQEFEQRVSEKVESDLRKNQELELKLYVDRISSVSDYSKLPASLLLAQIPPERGPQGFASEQQVTGAGKKPIRGGGGGGAPKLQSELRMEPQLALNSQRPKPHRGAASATPPTPPPTPSGIAAAAASSASAPTGRSLPRLALSVPRCKERRGASSAAPATPLTTGLQPVQGPSSIEV